jgi:uncharacterized protein (DUF1501 family)
VDAVTRRKFLIASGVVGASALAAGAAYTVADILGTAGATEPGPRDRILVLLTLYGGNDGLATVVPYADPAYHDARPQMAYDAGDVLRLDDHTGLNPALAGLKSLYDGGRLAIIRGVGYPKPDRSHFRSMDIWQAGDPVRPGTTWWLGRWLDMAGGDPRTAISLEPVLPPVLAGATSAGAAVALGRTELPPTVTPDDRAAMGRPSAGEPALQARASSCYADLLKVDQLMHDAVEAAEADEDDAGEEPATATGGAPAALATQLAVVATCVEAGVMTRVYSVSQGGFDFHANEKGAQEGQLRLVDTAVAGFLTRMAKTAHGQRVVMMIYSEFGRRVRANASDGTDHGTASNVLLAGASVSGGRLIGDQPSLTDTDDGDLKHHTDFRDVYASVLTDVLGADPAPVLAGWTGRLDGLVAT